MFSYVCYCTNIIIVIINLFCIAHIQSSACFTIAVCLIWFEIYIFPFCYVKPDHTKVVKASIAAIFIIKRFFIFLKRVFP